MSKLVVVLLLLFTASFAQADEVRPGRVMCSLVSPNGGFDLVTVKKAERDYTGSFDKNNLRFAGSYRSSSSAFTLDIGTLNEDGDVDFQIAFIEAKLHLGEFIHAKFKYQDSMTEIYCYFFPNT